MTTKHVWAFIIGVTLIILGADVYLYIDEIPRNSISQVIIDSSTVSPLLPWFVGLVMGFLGAHWFDTYSQK